MALTLYRITATDKLVVEDSLTPPVGGVAVTDSPTENLVDKAAWYKALDTNTPLDWTPTIYRTGLPESGTITQTGGTGVNVLNPRYCTFEELTLPPLAVGNGSASIATTSLFGTKSLKLTAAANDCYAYLGTTAEDYNVNITPNKKWIASFYVYGTTAIPGGGVQLFVATNTSGTHYPIGNYDIIPATTWTRVSGVIDLSTDISTKLITRVDNNISGAVVLFDGIMLEAQVGSLTTPSVYYEPPNFLTTYTGALDATRNDIYRQSTAPTGGAYTIGDLWVDTDSNPTSVYNWTGTTWVVTSTVGANLLNTYTIPTGTIPTSLMLTAGLSAMTYTPTTGTLTRTGGLSTLSSVNLNTATVATTLSTVALNIITTTVAHGYAQQNCVLYTDNGTAISGLVSGICYYVIYLSLTTFKLSATIPTATNGTGTAIALGAVTVGTTYNFNAVDYITTTAAHSYLQQHAVRYSHSSLGTTISGLVHTAVYYVVYLSATTFALATTAANAGAVSGGVVSSISLGATTVGTTYNFALYSWTGSGYSTTGLTGGAQVSFTTTAFAYGAGMIYMVGLNSDPTLNASFNTLDYAIYISGSSQLIYESGVNITKTGATNVYTVGDTFSIIYNGANLVNYYRNGTLFYSTYLVTPITVPLYMDSSFNEYGTGCTALKFSAYVAPVLLTGNNLNGLIHAGNAGDHLSDNIISTATVLPKAVSEFQSITTSSFQGTQEYNQEFGTLTASIRIGSIIADGDAYTQILALVGISHLVLYEAVDTRVEVVIQKESSNISDQVLAPATFAQAYEPALTPNTVQDWYVTAPYTVTFDAATDVNITTNTFTTAISDYYTGSRVRYTGEQGGASSLLDLGWGSEYYIIKLTTTTFKLAATFEDAVDKVPIPVSITAVGTGIHQFESPYYTYERYHAVPTKSVLVTPAAVGVNITTDVFTISGMFPDGVGLGDRIFTGMDLTYKNQSGGLNIAPLVSATTYYVIRITDTTFKLATTRANAIAATPVAINITSVGSGGIPATRHEFVGLTKWLLATSSSSFNIGGNMITPTTSVQSLTLVDSSDMGARTRETFIYSLNITFYNVRTSPLLQFASIFSIFVSKR